VEFAKKYVRQTVEICDEIDVDVIEKMAVALAELRSRGGRLFFVGSGGGAGHASHAVNDFRKIANIECYTPCDNVSELTARINDDGWDTSYSNWLKVSRFNSSDAVFVFSVGGGSLQKKISVNLVECVHLAIERKGLVLGIVGKDGGFTKASSELVVTIPTVDDALITPHVEGWQAVVWHLLVSHPLLAKNSMKWESVK